MGKQKIKKRGPSRRSSGKKNGFWNAFLFLASVAVVSFFLFRAYQQAFPTFQKVPKQTVATRTRNVRSVTKPKVSVKKSSPIAPVQRRMPSSVVRPVEVPASVEPVRPVKRWHRSGRLWTQKPKITIVIDDMGNSRANESMIRALGDRVTYAVLPQLPFTSFANQLAVETGAELILHQPMEPLNGVYPGPGVISVKMTDSQVSEILDNNLSKLSRYAGINNHMGSLGTQDKRLMTSLISTLKSRGAFFLDSRTSSQTISREIAMSMGWPVLVRDIFLDHVNETDAIEHQLLEAKNIAIKQGFVIAIGHDRPLTLKILRERIPQMEAEGFQFVTLGDLIEHRVGISNSLNALRRSSDYY